MSASAEAINVISTPLQKSTPVNSIISSHSLPSANSANSLHNEEEIKDEIIETNSQDKNKAVKFSINQEMKHELNATKRKTSIQHYPIPAWLSVTFRLDKFNNKEQTFTITGSINVHWKMNENTLSNISAKSTQSARTPLSKEKPSKTKEIEKLCQFAQKQESTTEELSIGGVKINYTNNFNERIVKVVDLRDSGMTHYVPIDATKIFHYQGLQSIEHIHPPALYYNTKTHLAHIQYQVTATLFENLELYDFPFDRQFLNIKLRWNTADYELMHWKLPNEKYQTPKSAEWWGPIDENDNFYALYYDNPLKVYISEELRSEIELLSPCSWIDFDVNACPLKYNKYALIRLRIKRNPTNFCLAVLIPFFIIVSCSFTIFAIDSNEIADRLGVSVTILLTFTAFQNMVDEELPKSSDTEFIDKYILLAYAIQGFIIIGSCLLPTVVNSMFDNDNETYIVIEIVWIILIVFIWIGFSLFYVSKAWNVLKDQNRDKAFWRNRAQNEYDEWADNGEANTTFEHWQAEKKDCAETANKSDEQNDNQIHSPLKPLLQYSKSQQSYESIKCIQEDK